MCTSQEENMGEIICVFIESGIVRIMFPIYNPGYTNVFCISLRKPTGSKWCNQPAIAAPSSTNILSIAVFSHYSIQIILQFHMKELCYKLHWLSIKLQDLQYTSLVQCQSMAEMNILVDTAESGTECMWLCRSTQLGRQRSSTSLSIFCLRKDFSWVSYVWVPILTHYQH
jgi:hypothetical protein